MDIDYLVDRLEALVTSGKRVPLSNKVMVDEQECLDLIDQMRAVVPEEVKAAKRTLLDRERILNDAEEDARQLLEHAEQERDIMISREGLLAETERRRDEVMSEAAHEAYGLRSHAQALYDEAVSQTQEMREGANNYTMQVLHELESLLGKHLGMVRNGLQSFQQQASQYQDQIEEYQRQNHTVYAPPPETRQPQSRPSTARSNSAPAPASRPENVSNRDFRDASSFQERDRPNTAQSSSPSPVDKKPASPAQFPDRRSPQPASGLNRGVTPVPKPGRSAQNEDQDDPDDNDFLNPGNTSSSMNGRSGSPNAGPPRPNRGNE